MNLRNKIRNRILKLLLPIVIVILIFTIFKNCKNEQYKEFETNNIIKSLNDDLEYYKNQNNQLVSKISVIETEKQETFLNIESKDKEILKLQKLLRDNKNANVITRIETLTIVDTTFVTETQFINFDEKYQGWIKGSTFSKPIYEKDGTVKKFDWFINLTIKDEVEIVHKRDSLGRMYVEASNLNPYSNMKKVRSYYKTQQPISLLPNLSKSISSKNNSKTKSFSIGPNISYGVNHKGEFLPYIGVGIQYNLIKF